MKYLPEIVGTAVTLAAVVIVLLVVGEALPDVRPASPPPAISAEEMAGRLEDLQWRAAHLERRLERVREEILGE